MFPAFLYKFIAFFIDVVATLNRVHNSSYIYISRAFKTKKDNALSAGYKTVRFETR